MDHDQMLALLVDVYAVKVALKRGDMACVKRYLDEVVMDITSVALPTHEENAQAINDATAVIDQLQVLNASILRVFGA